MPLGLKSPVVYQLPSSIKHNDLCYSKKKRICLTIGAPEMLSPP